jgi:hypothetical protein
MVRALMTAALLMVCWTESANAEWLGQGEERHLDGHGFLPSMYVPSPFVASNFQNHTGAAVAIGLKTTFRNLDGEELFTLEGDLFFAQLGLAYQQQLSSRIAIGAALAGLARSGTNAQSFITEGADVNRRADLWARYRAYRGQRDQVSIGLDWNYAKTLYFTPNEFARHIANGGSLEDAPIVVDDKNWASHIVTTWAHAFSPTFGARATAEVGLYEVPRSEGVSKGAHRLSLLGEMDLKHTRAGIPLGVSAGYTQNLPENDPRTGAAGWLLGFWYTGRPEFVVGAELGFLKFPVVEQSSDKVDAAFGVFMIQYYF